MRKNKLKQQTVMAVMVCDETLEIATKWCNGSIKGTKLPRSQRIVSFWSAARNMELEAGFGDYIACFGKDIFEVYPGKMFRAIFEDIDTVPY